MKRGDEAVACIDRVNRKGWGVGQCQERPIEVIGAIPGDEVKVKIFSKKRGVFKGDLLEVLHPSSHRVPLRCRHAPLCGGCTSQQMDYPAQLQEKQERLAKLFPHVEIRPIIPAVQQWRYRNKMEFSFSQNKAGDKFLGLVLAGTRGHVFNLTECHLISPWMATLLEQIRTWWQQSSLLAYRLDNTGSLRTLTLREGKNTGDKLIMLTVSGNPDYALSRATLSQFVSTVQSCFSEQEQKQLSLFLRIQQTQKGSPTQFFEMHLAGKDHLMEPLHLPQKTLHFKISPTSFFQPNTSQAEVLYATALSLISSPKEHILDLYAGTSTLSMAFASLAKQITSIEINPHACFDAEENKELNQLHHLDIRCGDVEKVLPQLTCHPDLVILDPPRPGLGPKTIALLGQLSSPQILYISCNPATQASDIQALTQVGYRLVTLQPVDQFPHTPHIETIALLSK